MVAPRTWAFSLRGRQLGDALLGTDKAGKDNFEVL